MAIRILHTADWQLGKPFAGLSGDTGALLRAARFDAVRTIARLAREHEVDAVLVAGDVFDDNYVERATVAKALAAMREFDGPWLLLPGNHDPALAASVWTRIAGDGPLGYRYDTKTGELHKLTHKAYKAVVAKAARGTRAHF